MSGLPVGKADGHVQPSARSLYPVEVEQADYSPTPPPIYSREKLLGRRRNEREAI